MYLVRYHHTFEQDTKTYRECAMIKSFHHKSYNLLLGTARNAKNISQSTTNHNNQDSTKKHTRTKTNDNEQHMD